MPKNLPPPNEFGVETIADLWILTGTTPMSMLIHLLKKRFSEKKVKTRSESAGLVAVWVQDAGMYSYLMHAIH